MAEWQRQGQWRLLSDRLAPRLPLLADWPPQPTQFLRDHAKVQAFLWQHEGRTVFIKNFRYWGLRRLAALLGRERGLAGYRAAANLQAAGIDTPTALVLIRDAGCTQSWLLTDTLTDAVNCHQLTERGATEELRERLFRAGFDVLLKLHQAGFAHGDFKWANLMWQLTERRMWLIDLDGVTRSRSGSKKQLRDLARFLLNAEEVGLPLAELKNAFNHYCQTLGLVPAQARAVFAPIHARLARRHGRVSSVTDDASA